MRSVVHVEDWRRLEIALGHALSVATSTPPLLLRSPHNLRRQRHRQRGVVGLAMAHAAKDLDRGDCVATSEPRPVDVLEEGREGLFVASLPRSCAVDDDDVLSASDLYRRRVARISKN